MNSWAQLIRLLPTVDSTVGKVLSLNTSNSTVVLAAIGGGSFVASIPKDATYEVNDWVLVKDNVVLSVIPVPKGENVSGEPKEIIID